MGEVPVMRSERGVNRRNSTHPLELLRPSGLSSQTEKPLAVLLLTLLTCLSTHQRLYSTLRGKTTRRDCVPPHNENKLRIESGIEFDKGATCVQHTPNPAALAINPKFCMPCLAAASHKTNTLPNSSSKPLGFSSSVHVQGMLRRRLQTSGGDIIKNHSYNAAWLLVQ